MTAGSTMKAKAQPQAPSVPRLPGKIRYALGSAMPSIVLVLIILFIQKRPRGLFALKGRAVEA